MSSLKIFEVAGSIAGLSGISLTVFYFLFNPIIQKSLPNLTKTSRRNIILLIFFMIWSITTIAMTTWIYSNTQNDGGQQPSIKKIEITEKPATINISQTPTTKIAMYPIIADLTEVPMLTLRRNSTFFNPMVTDDEDICGLKVRRSIWLSFNDVQPYYIAFQEEKVKVILKSMNIDNNKATFAMHIHEEGKFINLHDFTLNQNESYNFDYNECNYRFAYRGKTSWTTGIQYWFKTRYEAHFNIEPV
ncbi:MAG: hypothetical protein ACI97N_000570 [Cognaticolwellia sp.]|jgi:hypothetical protein